MQPQRSADTAPDTQALISASDLTLGTPAPEPVQGHPIGNGRMGTMVWTTPDSVEMQINRVDVFAVDKHHAALPQYGETDICGTCARVSLRVDGGVFAGEGFRQRLSLPEAEATIAGGGVTIRAFVSAVADLLVLEVDDLRFEPAVMRLAVSRWRPERVVHGGHTATLDLEARSDAAVLVQGFAEGGYCCRSAVAVRVVAANARVAANSDDTLAVTVPVRQGKMLVLISSAATRDDATDVEGQALAVLDQAAGQSYDVLREPHVRWWGGFWQRSFVRLTTPDPAARNAERARNLLLYVMASSSRGALPPKWNGSLFAVNGDRRTWGAQYWVWTTEMPYFPLHAAGCSDLADPFFDMYVAQLPDARAAARQRWDCAGAYFGETMPFDGPLVLPEEVATEFRGVFVGGQPGSGLSAQARELGQYEGSLNIVCTRDDLAAGRYTWISHVCSSGAEIAVHAWWRYRHTGDREWLVNHAYPLLRDVAEFYRTLVSRGDDGLCHIHGTNVHEDFWGVADSIMDLAAIRGTVPLAIRAAELLGLDADLRHGWHRLLAGLAPYPMGADPQAKALAGACLADDVWAAGHRGDVDGQHNPEDVWLNPVFPFEDWTAETRDPAIDRIVQRALDLAPRHASVLNGARVNTAIRTPIAAARAGRAADLPATLAAYWNAFAPLPNGFSLFEGVEAHSVEHLGLLTMTLQEALLQSVSPRPGEAEVISVFPAWPRQWDASFRLHARGGFEVTARCAGGSVEDVKVLSHRGEDCRLRSPWSECEIIEADGPVVARGSDVLSFPTTAGASYRVTRGSIVAGASQRRGFAEAAPARRTAPDIAPAP